MCDIGTINMRFYLLKIPYSHEYYRIIPFGLFYSTHTLEIIEANYKIKATKIKRTVGDNLIQSQHFALWYSKFCNILLPPKKNL
jgi:hypothetical protein